MLEWIISITQGVTPLFGVSCLLILVGSVILYQRRHQWRKLSRTTIIVCASIPVLFATMGIVKGTISIGAVTGTTLMWICVVLGAGIVAIAILTTILYFLVREKKSVTSNGTDPEKEKDETSTTKTTKKTEKKKGGIGFFGGLVRLTMIIGLLALVLWIGLAFVVPALGYRYATPEWSEWEKTIPGQATFKSDPGQDLDLEMVEADSNRPPVSFVHKNGAIHQLSREGIVGKVKTFRWRAIGNNSFWFKISYGPKRM